MGKVKVFSFILAILVFFSCHKNVESTVPNNPSSIDSTIKHDSTKVIDTSLALMSVKTTEGSQVYFEYDSSTKRLTKFYYNYYGYNFDSTYVYYNTDGTVRMYLENHVTVGLTDRTPVIFIYDTQKRLKKVYRKNPLGLAGINVDQLATVPPNGLLTHDSLVYDSKNRMTAIYSVGSDWSIGNYYLFSYMNYNDSLISGVDEYALSNSSGYVRYSTVQLFYDTSKNLINPYYRDLKYYAFAFPNETFWDFFPMGCSEERLATFLTLSKYPCTQAKCSTICGGCTSVNGIGTYPYYNAQGYPLRFSYQFDYIVYAYAKI